MNQKNPDDLSGREKPEIRSDMNHVLPRSPVSNQRIQRINIVPLIHINIIHRSRKQPRTKGSTGRTAPCAAEMMNPLELGISHPISDILVS